MKILFLILFLLAPSLASAQSQRNPCYYNTSPSNSDGCAPVAVNAPLPVAPVGYPSGSTPLTGNATGTTSAVVGTLANAAGKTTYICGFNVQAIGGTATVGPITIAGLTGSSQVYQTDVNSATVGKTVASATFQPCIPASAANTAITITTTANGTASAVDVNSWGYRQ